MLIEEFILRGIFVAVLTPLNYNDSWSLNLTAIPHYADYLSKKGVTGILVGATTGEGPALSLSERKFLAQEWAKAAKSKNLHLMVHIGGAPLPDVLKLAQHAEKLQVNSLLTLPELYYTPSNEEQLLTYLKLISEAAPKTPLLYYYTPDRLSTKVNIAKFLDEFGTKITTLVGLKYSSNDLADLSDILSLANANYTILLGADKLIYPACALGVEAFVSKSANIFPGIPSVIIKAWEDYDLKKSKEIQEFYSEVIDIFSNYGSEIQALKLAMRQLTSLNLGDVRLPWYRISGKNESLLMKTLENRVVQRMRSFGLD